MGIAGEMCSWQREVLRANAHCRNMLRCSGNSQEAAQTEEANVVGEFVGEDGGDFIGSFRAWQVPWTVFYGNNGFISMERHCHDLICILKESLTAIWKINFREPEWESGDQLGGYCNNLGQR